MTWHVKGAVAPKAEGVCGDWCDPTDIGRRTPTREDLKGDRLRFQTKHSPAQGQTQESTLTYSLSGLPDPFGSVTRRGEWGVIPALGSET